MSVIPYVSPVEQAKELLELVKVNGSAGISHGAIATAKRLVHLELLVASDLEAEQAPQRVMRWVAWGKRYAVRRQRADLVIHLRRTIHTPNNGWLIEPLLRAAFDVWQRAIDDARRRGLAQPRPEDLPVSAYEAAIAAATSSKKGSPATKKARGQAPFVLTEEERAALAALPALEGLLKRVG